MSKSHLLTGLGLILIILSLGTRLQVSGAESQANIGGGERLERLSDFARSDPVVPNFDPKSESYLSTVNENPGGGWKGKWILATSIPPGASCQRAHYEGISSLTPTILESAEDYTFSTRFRQGTFSQRDVKAKSVPIPLKTPYALLFALLYPGLALLAVGGWLSRKPKKKERVPGDSGVTIVRSPLPLPHSGPVRHDPDTPAELIFGDFIQGEHLGKGNMGEVYRCTSGNAADNRAYALKVLLPEWSNSDDFRKRFEREAAICQKLDHPNLVRAYQSGEKNGRLWLVMDYISGGELKDWLSKSERTVDEMLLLFQQVCSGLEYAHQNDVIHRDLKPDNILITDDGKAVIADFGLARGKHYETITKTNTTLGTPIYMPPEQVVGGTGSPSGDLYGLGCILYEMLSGRPPFEQTDVLVLLQEKLNGKLPPSLDDVPKELNDIVFKLLAYSPEERFQSASELSEKLSSLN